jgi:hypothetical protein
MTAQRTSTLLEFAIAASLAVVPVLFVVLLAVGWLRPVDAAARPNPAGDRHVSVRHVAALKTFEHAIVRRSLASREAPTAQALLAGIPACRGEWDGSGGTLGRLRRVMAKSGLEARSPAERIAAELKQLDNALERFSTGANRRVSDPVGLDVHRWIDAVATALRTPVEAPEYPGRHFVVQCADVAGAVAMLVRSDARMLDALAWRGTEVPQTIARWRADQWVEVSGRQLARANPWSGIPGCIYMGADAAAPAPTYFITAAHGISERVCAEPAMRGDVGTSVVATPAVGIVGEATPDMTVDDERWKVPPSLQTMLQPLEALQRPANVLYRMYTAAASADPSASRALGQNRILVGGAPVDVGFSIDLTIEPDVQAIAQKIAACYTGRQDVCQAAGVTRKEDESKPIGHRLLERAVVRMAAIAVIDVASGRIEALAGALSPCTRQEYDGPGRSAGCDKRMPYPIRYRPDALLNPAVFHDAMPASVIKPIMATAFLSDPDVGARWLASERAEWQRADWPTHDSLRGQLMRSDSARFLDRMFCAERGFAHCRRPWEIQQSALAFGWNARCAEGRDDCGKRDLLFGGAGEAAVETSLAPSLATSVPYGRLMVEPLRTTQGGPIRMRPPSDLDLAKVRACAAGADGRHPSRDDWEKCRGKVVVDVVAEGWGQGNARSSALGVAGMMAALAAAANEESAHPPHLVDAVRRAGPYEASRLELAVAQPGVATPLEQGLIAPEAATLILNALSYSHRGGTARLACEQVFDARTCRDLDWIAGKTGTPSFPNDDVSLDELARLCTRPGKRTRSEEAACGALRPYKWYVAVYRTDPSSPRWSKAIGVLTERNWIAETGRIHGAGDHGPNPAAEIALQIATRHAGYLTGDPQ